MDILTWLDEKIAACEKRATEVGDELRFVYLDAARDNRAARAAVAEQMQQHRAVRAALAGLLAQIDSGTSADYRALQELQVVRRARDVLATRRA